MLEGMKKTTKFFNMVFSVLADTGRQLLPSTRQDHYRYANPWAQFRTAAGAIPAWHDLSTGGPAPAIQHHGAHTFYAVATGRRPNLVLAAAFDLI
jgi:hypothetical protein